MGGRRREIGRWWRGDWPRSPQVGGLVGCALVGLVGEASRVLEAGLRVALSDLRVGRRRETVVDVKGQGPLQRNKFRRGGLRAWKGVRVAFGNRIVRYNSMTFAYCDGCKKKRKTDRNSVGAARVVRLETSVWSECMLQLSVPAKLSAWLSKAPLQQISAPLHVPPHAFAAFSITSCP